jgi:hypothetical protein
MPDSTEIRGDQKNTTVFGFSAPWVVVLTAVILAGMIGLAYVLLSPLRDGDTRTESISSGPDSLIESKAREYVVESYERWEQKLTGTAGPYEFDIGETYRDEKFPAVSLVRVENLAADVMVRVTAEPVQALSSADLPMPPDANAEPVQAILMNVEVDGEESPDYQGTIH